MINYKCTKCEAEGNNPKICVFKTETFHIPKDQVMIECEYCKHKENYENIIS